MKKKYIVLVMMGLLLGAVYFLFFHKDKNLQYIPENADIVVLIDLKRAARRYVASLLQNPSEWLNKRRSDRNTINFGDSGIKAPDYLQIFHLKNSKISEWYAVFEIDDQQKFLLFLKSHQLTGNGKNRFKNNYFSVKIEGDKCIIGFSDKNFENVGRSLNQKSMKVLNADSLITDGLGSISLLSEQRTQNFSIHLNDDAVVIKNSLKSDVFLSLIKELNSKAQILDAELDSDNIEKLRPLYDENCNKPANINFLKISADLEEINDTIISYGYDDNFNEIEKVSYQKIVQPDYEIRFKTSDPKKAWNYFSDKKWINAQNQFTAIPFQPNTIIQNGNEILIKSVRKNITLSKPRNQNYIFVKNNPLLYSSLKNFISSDQQCLKDIEYFFYANRSRDYYVKIKFKKQRLPLILR